MPDVGGVVRGDAADVHPGRRRSAGPDRHELPPQRCRRPGRGSRRRAAVGSIGHRGASPSLHGRHPIRRGDRSRERVRTAATGSRATRRAGGAAARRCSSRSARRTNARRPRGSPSSSVEPVGRLVPGPAYGGQLARRRARAPAQPHSRVRSLWSVWKLTPWSTPNTRPAAAQDVAALAVGVVDQDVEHRQQPQRRARRRGSPRPAGRRRPDPRRSVNQPSRGHRVGWAPGRPAVRSPSSSTSTQACSEPGPERAVDEARSPARSRSRRSGTPRTRRPRAARGCGAGSPTAAAPPRIGL